MERILNNIKSLLDEAEKVDERYGVGSGPSNLQGLELVRPRGLDIFRVSFEKWKSRIKKHQKDTATWKVARWAAHDANKFEVVVGRLKDFVDGLESITVSLGLLEEQHDRLREEIESIADAQDLRLLRDASSRHGTSEYDISDTASRRLLTLTGSIIEDPVSDEYIISSRSVVLTMNDSLNTARSRFSGNLAPPAESFTTARSNPYQSLALTIASFTSARSNLAENLLHVPEVGQSIVSSEAISHRSHIRPKVRSLRQVVSTHNVSCAECLDIHYRCTPSTRSKACMRCVQTHRECSFLSKSTNTKENSFAIFDTTWSGPVPVTRPIARVPSPEIPQHQRLLNGLTYKTTPRKPLSFKHGDAKYGEKLRDIKKEDEEYWLENSGKLLFKANNSSSAAKRMFFELRNIRAGKVPFVTAAPVDDNLDKVLASIEGPPETPYEGGIFWLTIKLSEIDPSGPPLIRFQTKIYHPNVSPQGYICADYQEKWNSVLSAGSQKTPVTDPSALWYLKKTSNIQWSLGALLTALCGLLASPNIDDPLVPEIAQLYIEDYDKYSANARLYTQRFATTQRPVKDALVFLEADLPFADPIRPENLESPTVEPDRNNTSTSGDDEIPNLEFTKTPNRTMMAMQLIVEDSSSDLALYQYEWAEHLKLVPVFHAWKNLKMSRSGTTAQESSDQQNLLDLLLLSRQEIDSKEANLDIEDTEIAWLLLSKAKTALENRLPSEFTQSEALLFYTIVKDVCEKHLIEMMTTGIIEVSYSTLSNKYVISIKGKDSVSSTGWVRATGWLCHKPWNEVVAFQKHLESRNLSSVNDTIDRPLLWGLDDASWKYEFSSTDENAQPDPQVMAVLLEYSFNRVFQACSMEQSESSKILRFLRPGPVLQQNDPDPGNAIILPAYNINIVSFIPRRVLTGTEAFKVHGAKMYGEDVSETSQRFFIHLAHDHGFRLVRRRATLADWSHSHSVAKIDHVQQCNWKYHDTVDVDEVCSSKCLEIVFGQSSFGIFHFLFESERDALLWHDTLKMLIHILPLL